MNMKYLIVAALAAACLAFAPTGAMAQEKADAHKDHGHSHGHEGKREELGTTETAGLKLTAIQIGKVEAGKEGIFEVIVAKGPKPPKAVRMWVGVASAEGSTKSKAENDAEHYESHLEVPATLPAGSQLWVEIEPATGKKQKVAFDLKH